MTLNLRGLGDAAADCGTNPCGFTDWIWATDPCQAYLRCSETPAQQAVDVRLTDIVTATAAEAGQLTGSVVSGAATGFGTGISSNANVTGGLTMVAVGAAALLLLVVLMKR